MSVKFTNQGGSRFDGNGGSALHGNQQVDIIAYSRDASRFVGVQVKALSKRNPVPLGTSLDKVMGDFWIIVNKVATAPSAYIMLPSEVTERAHRGEKEGRVSYWLQPADYEHETFKEAWERIGHGA